MGKLETRYSTLQRLKTRVDYLEDLSRWYAYALDLVTSMLRLHGSGENARDPLAMLHETHSALVRLINFRTSAYLLVDDATSEFIMVECRPPSQRVAMQQIVDGLISGGEFAWALQQNRAVPIRSVHIPDGSLMLHVIATVSSVHGMFVGVHSGEESELTSSRLNLLSILLHNCAYAMENAALQQQLREANRTLEERIKQALSRITEQNSELTRKVEALKRTEEALVEAKRAAEAANHAKSRFLATMSHEIRTPMNAIIGMAQMLNESHLTDEQTGYVSVFQKAGENLLTLINDILDLSKIEAGKVMIEEHPFDLHGVLADVMSIFSLHAKELGLTIQCKIAPDVAVWHLGDSNRLRQILVNLIGNALKFTLQGSVVLSVCMEENVEDGVRFAVEDTGIGIPKDKQESIFSEFTQVDSSTTRQYGGSGLGLTISRRLILAMGGRIWVESEEGRGSTFHFRIPLQATTNPLGHSVANLQSNDQELVNSNRPLHILLVEDSEDNALLVRLFLKGERYEVTLVENGQQAVERYCQQTFDLILMDMQMPIMDGFEATEAIRRIENQDRLPHVPIIALTAYAFIEDQQKCRESGCDDYLAKPIRKSDLLAIIDRHVQP